MLKNESYNKINLCKSDLSNNINLQLNNNNNLFNNLDININESNTEICNSNKSIIKTNINLDNLKSLLRNENNLDNNLNNLNRNENKNKDKNNLKKSNDIELIDKNIINYDNKLESHYYDKFVNINMKYGRNLSGKQHLLIIPLYNFFRNVRNLYILVNILSGKSNISLRIIEYFVVNYVLDNNTYFNKMKYEKDPGYLLNNLFTFNDDIKKINKIENNNVNKIENNNVNKIENNNVNKIENNNDFNNETINTLNLSNNINNLLNELSTTSKTEENNFVVVNNQEVNNQEVNNKCELDYHLENDFDNYILVHDNYKHQLKQYNKRNFDPFSRGEQIKIYYKDKSYFNTTVCQLNFLKWAIENYILDYIMDNIDDLQKAMSKHEKESQKEKEDKQDKLNKLKTKKNISNIQNKQLSNDKFIINIGSFSSLDKKSNKKPRKKKEFTKTNRSVLQYKGFKTVSFDM